jgi:hypothetical protein
MTRRSGELVFAADFTGLSALTSDHSCPAGARHLPVALIPPRTEAPVLDPAQLSRPFLHAGPEIGAQDLL